MKTVSAAARAAHPAAGQPSGALAAGAVHAPEADDGVEVLGEGDEVGLGLHGRRGRAGGGGHRGGGRHRRETQGRRGEHHGVKGDEGNGGRDRDNGTDK